ncbi:MAG: ATP-binding protein [Candidatus Auribacterota bacterium]|nr:ATP-binding protein [Candidatus Auribacterota bacterium]
MKKQAGSTVIAERIITVENDILAIEPMVHKLTATFKDLFDCDELHTIAIGLTEMLINAIEHGNLELSYQEKSRLLDDGLYYEELKRRQFLPEYQNRKVTLRYKVTGNNLIISIKDDGNGFDWRGLTPARDRVTDVHGRGICMTRYYFDEVRFNDKGNEVTLLKTTRHE